MDGQQYLDQISPATSKGFKLPGILSSTLGKAIVAGLVGLILIIILAVVGLSLGGSKTGAKSSVYSLNSNLSTFAQIADYYEPYLKSSELRNYTSSLAVNIADSTREIDNFIAENYDNSTEAAVTTAAYLATLEEQLFEATVSASFDAAYARKMAIAANKLLSDIQDIYGSSSSSSLKSVLSSVYDRLSSSYDQFNNYSE